MQDPSVSIFSFFAVQSLCFMLQRVDKSVQVEEPVYFVDFLREPEEDPETGEVIDAHPSFYEAIPKGLPEVRTRVEALQAKFNEESRVYKLELVRC